MKEKILIATFSLAVVLFLIGITAKSASAAISPSLLASISEEIKVLLERIRALQSQLNTIQTKDESSKPTSVKKETPELKTSTLSRGARGEEVRELQKFLSNDPSIYPEKSVSGYFGLITERALKKFQTKYDIKATGIVDQETRNKILELKSSSLPANPPLSAPKEKTKTPIPNTKTKTTTDQLTAIEEELSGAKQGTYLSSEHADRIYKDLAALETKGYQKDKIESLKKKVLELSPHLQDQIKKETEAAATPAPKNCVDAPPVLITDFTDFSKIKKITAPGSSSSEGPKGHSFIWTEHARVPIYAPTAVTFDSGSYSKDTEYRPAQYLLIFEVKDNCNYQIKFAHIDDPVPAIKEQLPAIPAIADSRGQVATKKIEFQTGDVIGYTAGTNEAGNWDFGLYNLKEKGVLATQYNSYGLHGYAVCWVDFYAGEKQTEYRQLLEGPKLLCSF